VLVDVAARPVDPESATGFRLSLLRTSSTSSSDAWLEAELGGEAAVVIAPYELVPTSDEGGMRRGIFDMMDA